MLLRTLVLAGLFSGSFAVSMALAATPTAPKRAIEQGTVDATVAKLVAKHGPALEPRIRLGVTQAAQRWWPEDGDAAAFGAFCADNFLADKKALDAAFSRLEAVLEQIEGHLHEVRRELLTPLDLDSGPVSPVDRLLADVNLATHVDEDLFKTKVAFFALLNWPVRTLADALTQGPIWSRGEWAQARMMDTFADRVPAAVSQEMSRVLTAADQYIAEYNIRMDRLVTPEGKKLFPDGLSLITHWGLRDELASHYGEADGLAKQRMVARVMDRIVRQEIPAAAINNPDVVWCPQTNAVAPAPGAKIATGSKLAEREPDTRYDWLLQDFRALSLADPYSPTAPTAIARVFEEQRQIPEKQVEDLLVSVLSSPEVGKLGALISKRLGRPLEPFDIWYSGFKSRAAHSEAELDASVSAKYPTVASFQADLPNILQKLGFAPEKAAWVAARVVVDPSRGAGHAMGAVRRGDNAHLRTRIPAGGMQYKGYNIAVHEFGHNIEQTFSLEGVDHWFLNGVPNNAFTEALAMVCQERDLELLGIGGAATTEHSNRALGTLWATYEIGGVSLVDMRVWRWMYAHPDATPAQLREATLAIAREVWNGYFAPVFGVKDSEILAIYSHMIAYPLYLADYAIGHIIAFQVAEKLHGPTFGAEFERIARQGRVTPDAWMRGAVGQPISAQALLREAHDALARVE